MARHRKSTDASTLSPEDERTRRIEAAINETYPGLQMIVRDMNLKPEIAAKYVKGSIVRELAYVEGTSRVAGMVTTHRIAILSNHMLDVNDVLGEEKKDTRGLCVAKRGSHFKVLGTHEHKGKTMIVLLHLPNDETWKLFDDMAVNIDEDVFASCVERFEAKCDMPPIPELATQDWLARCAFPIGMDDLGNLYALD
ncbi:MAG: hypothetical protein LBR22_05455 [Desulfovibrio sp.]|jgi:hypothetical protein|nr:hypothetical protein [Desulfovibrio sp.]